MSSDPRQSLRYHSSSALNAATLLWIVIMRPYTLNNGPLTARQLLFVRLYTKLLITKFLRQTHQS